MNSKKLFSLFLIFMLVASLIPENKVAKVKEGFSDLGNYKSEINELVDFGIIKGYEDGTFRPHESITREHGVAMIVREMKLDTSNPPNPHFKDVKPGQNYYDEIATAVKAGIIKGKTRDTFGFNEKMTRAQMSVILVRAYDLQLKNEKNHSFKDVSTKHWAYSYISKLASNEIANGYTNGTFKPGDYLTRLHFSLFLSRYIKKVKNKQPEPPKDTELEASDLIHKFDLKADKEKIVYGETVLLTLQVSDRSLNYQANWQATGGKLVVAKDGKTAVWSAEVNSNKEYSVSLTIESPLNNGDKITFNKKVLITVQHLPTGGGADKNITLPPYQATVNLSKYAYKSGEEVFVTGVLQDRNGQALTNKPIKLDEMTTITDNAGNYTFSFIAINEAKEYRLYYGETSLKIKMVEGQVVDSFKIVIDNENIDLKSNVVGLNSTTITNLIEFKNGEKAVFQGNPEGLGELSIGSIFVTAPTEEYPLGTFGKVESIQYERDKTIIYITEPKLEEVFSKLEVEGTQTLSIENIIPEDGVKVYRNGNVQNQNLFRISELFLADDINLEFVEIELLDVEGDWEIENDGIEAMFEGEAEVDLSGKLELTRTEVEYDFSLLEGGGELIFKNEQNLSIGLEGELNGSGEVSVRVAQIFIPISGPVGVLGSLWVVVGAEGEITFKIGYDQTSELEVGARSYNSGGINVIDPIGNYEVIDSGFTTEAEGEVSIKSGIKPNLYLSIFSEEIIGLTNEIGIKGRVKGSIDNILTEDVRFCSETEISLYAQAIAEVKAPFKAQQPLISWEHSLDKTESCPPPADIMIEPTQEFVEKGSQIQLKVTKISDERDYTQSKEGTEYTLSDDAIGTVSKDGLLTIFENAPVGKEFTVTAENNNERAVANFKVIEIKEIGIEPNTIKILSGGKKVVRFFAILTNDEVLQLNTERFPINLTVEDESIATINRDGEIVIPEGVLPGMTTTLTATFRTFNAHATIEVVAPETQEPVAKLEFIVTPPVAAGYKHSIYVKDDGTVWSWGLNDTGQLGTGNTQNQFLPVQVPGLSNIIAVAAGTSHSLALSKDGSVWAWGANTVGQLGNGNHLNSLTPVQVVGIDNAKSIATGADTSYAILPDGSVKSWGNGQRGLLGHGLSQNSNVPVDVLNLTGVVSIDSSINYWHERHTVALKNDGTVWTWGVNYFGALGTGPHLSGVWNKDSLSPVQVSGLNGEGHLKDIARVQAGDTHTLALGKDGTVYGWGKDWGEEFIEGNNHPVTKTDIDGTILDDVKEISTGGYQQHIIIRKDGSVWSWDNSEALQQIPNLENVEQISTGGFHSFAFTKDTSIWSWGWNDSGQLGAGTTASKLDNPTKLTMD